MRILERLGLLLFAVVASCADRAESAPPVAHERQAPSVVADFTVDTVSADVPLELPAQLYVEHDAIVVARSAGTIDSLLADLGDHVTAGQTLARMESADQDIAVSAAEAAHDNLARTAARARSLARFGGVTTADSERVELELRQAEIARRKARRDLELTHIVAPFDGAVTERLVRPHHFVSVGDSLFRVTEAAPLFARVRVPQASAVRLEVGASVDVVGNGGVAKAVIERVSPIVDAASDTREAVVKLMNARDGLMAGASVTVRLGHARTTVVAVPREAIAPGGYALVVENGHTSLRSITLGPKLDRELVEVRSGLSLGERLARP
jgi:RND family efflux transporter MFP subunit